MTTIVWIIVLVTGLVVAFVAGRYTAPRTARLRDLERQRDEATGELRRFQDEVNSHFERTGQLFNEITGSYRSLYEHLADGAQRLGRNPGSTILSTAPEQRRLQERPDERATVAEQPAAASAQSGGSEPERKHVATSDSPEAREETAPQAEKEGDTEKPDEKDRKDEKGREEQEKKAAERAEGVDEEEEKLREPVRPRKSGD
jgi:uncharacterized protein